MTIDDMPKKLAQSVFVMDTLCNEWVIRLSYTGRIALINEHGHFLGIVNNIGKTGFTVEMWVCNSLAKARVKFENLTVIQK
jgi:hypothetical protein